MEKQGSLSVLVLEQDDKKGYEESVDLVSIISCTGVNKSLLLYLKTFETSAEFESVKSPILLNVFLKFLMIDPH